MKFLLAATLLALCRMAFSQESAQQEKNPRTLGPSEFAAVKAPSPPSIDGELTDEEWAQAPQASPFLNAQHQRERGTTKFFLLYDSAYIYFAATIKESHPPKATITGTNVALGMDDYVSLAIDTFGDGRYQNFSRCAVNALGATSFYKAGGSSQKREWLGAFEAKAKINPDGWQVEARVPWSILRIPQSGIRDLRFNFSRRDTKTEENYAYMVPRDTDPINGIPWKGVEVPPNHAGNLWKFLASANAAAYREKMALHPSLDVRGFLNDKYELSAVLFPDFSLINRVASFIGFSHYEVLLPETRPFFQEGAGYFAGVSPIFTSQRIDEFDLGFRMYGSATPSMKLGLNGTLAFDGEETFAGSVQQTLNESQSISAGFASVRGRHRPSNEAAAVSFDAVRGGWYFSSAGAFTQDQERGAGSSLSMYGGYSQSNVSFNASMERIDKKFEPRLGYSPETGVQGVSASAGYGYYVDRRWLSSAGMNLSHSRYWEIGGGLARESTYLSGYSSIRQVLSLYASTSTGSFAGVSESSSSVGLYFPNSLKAPWSIDLSTSFYRSGGDYSTLRSVSLGYADPHSKWGIYGGLTEYVADTTAVQRYVSFSYKLSPYETLTFNYLNDQGSSNGAIQYGRRNNRGIEYFLALGDPSAETFTPSIVARVVIPFR